MYRITRIVAALLLALAPLIGAQSVGAIGRDAWPTYPSMYFSSTLCQFASGGATTFVNCAPGGQMVSQINSSYQCNQINVSETGYEAGPVSLTMVTNDGLNSQTISIDSNGTWYVQIPGPFPLNAVVLEFSLPDGGGFLLPTIYSSPCPVATNTPTSAPSNTPNPSDTPTATVNPSFTPTAIPTHTPLPMGHATFTATPTATTGSATATPTSSGPLGACGEGFYECLYEGSVYGTSYPLNPPWVCAPLSGIVVGAYCPGFGAGYISAGALARTTVAGYAQAGVLPADGSFCWNGTYSVPSGTAGYVGWLIGPIANLQTDNVYYLGNGVSGSIKVCSLAHNAGTQLDLFYGSEAHSTDFSFVTVTFEAHGVASPTPGGPGTATPVPTNTITPTPILSPSATPYVNPFWTATPGTPGTAIPTDTECPGGCAVTQLTTVPGISTMITVDTNPFSPLTHLTLSRSPCTPFGYVQIPYPVITGTPALGQPLQFGWTVPITHTWDDTNIITNTAIQPCAMAKEVTPYVWDFTYWGSGVALAIVFTIWLIGWVGRLSGDHTVDG